MSGDSATLDPITTKTSALMHTHAIGIYLYKNASGLGFLQLYIEVA